MRNNNSTDYLSVFAMIKKERNGRERMIPVRRNERAFTLIEIMVVVLIIAILLGMAIPNFLKARENSRAKTCQTNMREIEQAKEHWAMDCGMGADATPTQEDLVTEYMRAAYEDILPACPSGGDYEINNMQTQPTCTIAENGDGETDDHLVY